MFRCTICGARFAIHLPVCTNCFRSHTLLPFGERPRAALDAEVEVSDAKELSRAVWQRIEIPAYPTIELRKHALVTVVGRAGAGKSSFIGRALDSVQGTTLLQSIEEPNGPTLAVRFARLGIKRASMLVVSRGSVDQVATLLRDRKVVAMGIDSVQRSAYEPRDLRHVLVTIPSLALLLVTSQVTKSGDIRGTEELRHESDVVIEVEGLRWLVTKSRYQSTGVSGDVLPKEDTHAAQ
jgi:predicted ATP-dependent serine protease